MKDVAFKQSVEKMGIYELRQFARQIGVPSPTTKKRAELLELIDEYSNGNAKNKVFSNKGRPPKNVQSVASYYDVMIPSEFKIKDELANNMLVLKNTSEKKIIKALVEGYLRKSATGYYYLNNKNQLSRFIKIFVPDNLVDSETIVGDYIKGIAIGDEDQLYAMLENMNGTEKLPVLCSYDDICDEHINSVVNVLEGSRIIRQDNNIRAFFENIVSNQENYNGYEIVCLASNVSNEMNAYIHMKLNAKAFVTSYEQPYKELYEHCEELIDYIVSRVCHGKKIILYIYDILEVLNCLDLYFGNEGKSFVKGHTLDAVQIIKKLFAAGRIVNGGASVTVIATAKDLSNEFINQNLEMIATKVEK